jgi:hypothetical protein
VVPSRTRNSLGLIFILASSQVGHARLRDDGRHSKRNLPRLKPLDPDLDMHIIDEVTRNASDPSDATSCLGFPRVGRPPVRLV